ncbi:TRAP transporter substrate-binding protein [Oceaniglobus ichthyenteri]|uniref:TRAP transporter substrate-binding protein n=1 Tax=Oceaniglobus ichthyenteri TaxID=2136177 RepID=UPI0013DDA2F4|nr:TRAP transporter substrate-binding protein [Oceaniglobus ichthyenteri]
MKIMNWLTMAALALPLAAAPALAQDYTLKVASSTANDVIQNWMDSFKAGIEEKSNGRIAVELYPANQLGQVPATIEGVAFGTIEVTVPASGFFVPMDPRFEVFDVPSLFNDLEHAQRVLADPEVAAHIAEYGNDRGMSPIAVFPHSPLAMLTIAGVPTIASLKGQRIRAVGPTALHIQPLTDLGALPTAMPLGEVMPGMQNKLVDGLMAGTSVYPALRFWDVAKDMTLLPNSYAFATAVASRDFMATLDDDLRALVRSEALVAAETANAWNIAAVDRGLDTWRENGGTVVEWTAEENQQYLDNIQKHLPSIIESNPTLGAEIDFFKAAAERLAQ